MMQYPDEDDWYHDIHHSLQIVMSMIETFSK